MTIKCNKKN